MVGRDGDRAAAGASLKRRIRAALTERLAYKAAALFFAIVLWLVVSAEEPSEELVPVRLEATYDSARVLTTSRPILRALVAGRARDLIKLYDTPPVVRRVIRDDEPDSVAFDVTPADVFMPPDVDAIVRDVQPRTVLLIFDVTTTRQLPVKNEVRVLHSSDGHVAEPSHVRIAPESVLVTGPRRAVAGLSAVSTVGETLRVRDSGEFLIPLDVKPLGRAVKVQPSEVRLSVSRPTTPPPADSTRPLSPPR